MRLTDEDIEILIALVEPHIRTRANGYASELEEEGYYYSLREKLKAMLRVRV